MKAIVFCLTLLITQFSIAQSFVIRNVTVFDGEKIIAPTSVLVENGIITAVDKDTRVKTQHIDGTGKFLMPAMTNSHVHAWAPSALRDAASAGVLNVLDMHGVEMAQGMMKNLKDSTNYARYYVAGAAATVPGGHGTQYGFPTPTLIKPEEAADFVAERIKAGAHYLKIIVEPWKETLSQETVTALIEAAHANNINAVVHISRAEDATTVLMNGADGLVHMWWDKIITTEELKDLAKENNAFIMPTLLTTQLMLKTIRPSAPDGSFLTDEELFAQVKQIYDVDIPIIAGTDPPNADINYGTDLYKELVLFSRAGIPNIEVLKTATSTPAIHFKLGNVGSIAPGYKADMLLLDGDPIKDIQNISTIHTIWKEGVVVKRN